MDFFNNWLLQAIIGNIVWFILVKIVKWFIKNMESNNSSSNKTVEKYSEHTLKKQFYISLVVSITSAPLFFFTSNQYLKAIAFLGIFFGIILMDFAFECSLEYFKDNPTNRSE